MTNSNLSGCKLENSNINSDTHLPDINIRAVISQTKALPPLPGSALRIINLAQDHKASALDLAEIIELDPLLTVQIIRWASSSLYGYRGKITSVLDAITRVLGFNFVLDLALGLAVLAPLKSPQEGLMGTRMFWIHALSSVSLMKSLAEKLPESFNIKRDEVFLVSLLHNIGFPLIGHLFPTEFAHLNTVIEANSLANVTDLETSAFGNNHTEIGAWLMRDWAMPAVLIQIVYHHHNSAYRGVNYHLNLLTYLSDCLLGEIGIGDAINQICPDGVYQELALNSEDCHRLLQDLHADMENIIATAEQLSKGGHA
ncbi:HDOD domain-containing protein [Methylomonas sp. AM2-LC]|uniref:HDOD domain-containing protein n=1 Tax=Methylomonas sp. AM2-LC TaxID=3153301 RepID=UPI003265C966